MRTVDSVIARMCQAAGVTSEAQLARALGKAKNTVSTWKARGSVPVASCEQVSRDRGVSLDWLLTGQGEMRLGEGPAADWPLPAGLHGLEKRVAALLHLMSDLSQGDRDAFLTECFARAADKKRIAELGQAIQDLEAKLGTGG